MLDFNFKYRGTFAGLNANTITAAGWWRSFSLDPVSQNLPAGYEYSIIWNYPTDVSYVVQMALNLSNSQYRRRHRTATVWSDWINV